MFILASRRRERASLIVTSGRPFSAGGAIFGDEVTATAMIACERHSNLGCARRSG
jgi:hypothetical protein